MRYRYDGNGNGNRTAVELPGGSGLENLYYGSGHLHRIAFDGETVTDIERDRLHRETGRTQGRLASRYTLDPLGRLKSQLAVPAGPSESKGKAAVTAAVKRSYGYDRTGNLTQSTDPRTGTTQFEYDKLGRITRAGDELFAFDPAHNIVDIPARPSENMPEGISAAADKAHTASVKDNRIKTYDGAEYYYDTFGNLTFMSLPDGSSRTLSYDLKDRLVLAEIWREGGKEIWRYEYDALDRRIAKEQVEVGEEHRPAADEKGRLKTVPGIRTEFIGKFIMKIKVIMLSIIGLILSGYSLANEEIKFSDIWNFKISVKENRNNKQIRLTGLLGNSAMGISDIKTNIHNDELNIILFQKLAGSKYSGRLDKEVTVEKSIKKITFGSKKKIVWESKP